MAGRASTAGATGGGGRDGYRRTCGGETPDSLDRTGLTSADIWRRPLL